MSETDKIISFLDAQRDLLTQEQWQKSYRMWGRGGSAWNKLELGGTYQMLTLAWYQWIYKPKSKEWRPSIIIAALRKAALE